LKKKIIENREAVVNISNRIVSSDFIHFNLKDEISRSFERQGFLIRFEVDLSLPQTEVNARIEDWMKSQERPMRKYTFLFNDIIVITEMGNNQKNTGTIHLLPLISLLLSPYYFIDNYS
jgi:hypothetical protein